MCIENEYNIFLSFRNFFLLLEFFSLIKKKKKPIQNYTKPSNFKRNDNWNRSFFFSLILSYLLTQSHPLSGNSYVSNTASRMSGITICRERLSPTYQDYNAIKCCTVYVTAYLAKKATSLWTLNNDVGVGKIPNWFLHLQKSNKTK